MATVSPACRTRPTAERRDLRQGAADGGDDRVEALPRAAAARRLPRRFSYLGAQTGLFALQTLDLDPVLGVLVLLLGVDTRRSQAERFGRRPLLFRL